MRVCVDLDGTLAKFEKWKGIKYIGDPFPGAVTFMKKLSKRATIIIFTARLKTLPDNPEYVKDGDKVYRQEDVMNFIKDWLDKHGFPYDEIYTGTGKPYASLYIDDRGVYCSPAKEGKQAYYKALKLVDLYKGRG